MNLNIITSAATSCWSSPSISFISVSIRASCTCQQIWAILKLIFFHFLPLLPGCLVLLHLAFCSRRSSLLEDRNILETISVCTLLFIVLLTNAADPEMYCSLFCCFIAPRRGFCWGFFYLKRPVEVTFHPYLHWNLLHFINSSIKVVSDLSVLLIH